jgi:hypothetical protein
VDEHQWLAARSPKEVGDIDWDMHGNLSEKLCSGRTMDRKNRILTMREGTTGANDMPFAFSGQPHFNEYARLAKVRFWQGF